MRNCILTVFLISVLLTISLSAQASAASTAPIPYLRGFPRTEPSSIDYAGPTVVDIDSDGKLDILVADSGGCIWAWDHRGLTKPNFPIAPANSCRSNSRINSLAVASIDSDPHPEIIIGSAGRGRSRGQLGKVYVYNPDGTPLPGWPQEMEWNRQFGTEQAEVYSVAAANVTGSAALEVLAGTSNNSSSGGPIDSPTPNLYVWNNTGELQDGFPQWHRRAGIYGLIGAGDLDDDPCLEIIAPRDHRWLHVYDSDGDYLPGWPAETFVDVRKTTPAPYLEFTRNAPSIADLDGDGIVEIVIAGRVKQSEALTGSELVIINSGVLVFEPDGERKAGWQVARLGNNRPLAEVFGPSQAPALADLNRDGLMEIVVTLSDGNLWVYRHEGSLLWRYDFARGRQLFASEPTIGDVDGDGQLDIVFGTYSPEKNAGDPVGIFALDLHGKILPGFPLPLDHETDSKKGVRSAPTLTDLDGDGDVEIVAASWSGTLYVWDLPSAYRAALMPWPTARHDNQRTGYYPRSGIQEGYPKRGLRFEIPFFIPAVQTLSAASSMCD